MKTLLGMVLLSVSLFEATTSESATSSGITEQRIPGIYKVQLRDDKGNIVEIGNAYMSANQIRKLKDATAQQEGIDLISKAMDIADYLDPKDSSLNEEQKSIIRKAAVSVPDELLVKIGSFNAGAKLNGKLEDKFNPRLSPIRYILDLKNAEVKDQLVTIPYTAQKVEFKVTGTRPTPILGKSTKAVLIESNQLNYVLKAQVLLTPRSLDALNTNISNGFYTNEELYRIFTNDEFRGTRQECPLVEITIIENKIENKIEKNLGGVDFSKLLPTLQKAEKLTEKMKTNIFTATELLLGLPYVGEYEQSPMIIIRKHDDQECSFNFITDLSYPVLSVYFTAEKIDEWYKGSEKILAYPYEGFLLPAGSTLTRIQVGDKEFIPTDRKVFKQKYTKNYTSLIYRTLTNAMIRWKVLGSPVESYDAINLNEAYGSLLTAWDAIERLWNNQ